MRCITLLIALLTVIIAGSLVYNHTREDRWRLLPDGGEIRLVSVTYEKSVHVKIGGSIFDPLRTQLSPSLVRFLGAPPIALDSPPDRQNLGKPTLVTWFTTRLVGNNHLPEGRFSIVHGDEEILSDMATYNKLGTTQDSRELIGLAFDSSRLTDAHLQIRFAKNGQTLNFFADNPCCPAAKLTIFTANNLPRDTHK